MTENTAMPTKGQHWTAWLMSCNWSIVILACCLFSVTAARAGDYAVAYALDLGDLRESGTTRDCSYDETCWIAFKKLDLSIDLIVSPSDRDQSKDLSISVYGGRSRHGCCYFTDGDRTRHFRLEEGVAHLTLYEGHARRRNEFIVNSRLGTPYLQFADMK